MENNRINYRDIKRLGPRAMKRANERLLIWGSDGSITFPQSIPFLPTTLGKQHYGHERTNGWIYNYLLENFPNLINLGTYFRAVGMTLVGKGDILIKPK